MRGKLLKALCLSCAALALTAAPASARHFQNHTLTSSFSPTFGVSSIGVDEETGSVYVVSAAPGLPLEKYTADGTPSPFTAPEANSSTIIKTPGAGGFYPPSVTVDNSGNPGTRGRIYIADGGQTVYAYERNGTKVGGNFPLPTANFQSIVDIQVEPGTGNLWVLETYIGTSELYEYTPQGEQIGDKVEYPRHTIKGALDSKGLFYLTGTEPFLVNKFDRTANAIEELSPGQDVDVDPINDDVYVYAEAIRQYSNGGSLLATFGSPPGGGTGAVAVNGSTGRVYRSSNGEVQYFDRAGAPLVVPDATTGDVSNILPTSATIHGAINPDGVSTTDCFFQWGLDLPYAHKEPCAEGAVLTGTTPQAVSLSLTGLEKGKRYHYRVGATNGTGTLTGLDATFTPSALPTFGDEHVGEVHSDSVVLLGAVNPEGAAAHYHFEYGLGDCSTSACTSTPTAIAPISVTPQLKNVKVSGLKAGTTYHYRLVADNQTGGNVGGDHTFTTFPFTELRSDSCPNAHVRQQTGTALLLDCRAYELVSAAKAGGYNTESGLVPGETPFAGYPQATAPSTVLYGVHDGAIPGVGNPANRGLDTYVATREDDGWKTKYVGIPSDNPFATGPFASTLLEADPKLDSFAYGGEELCSPCFEDGSTNIPLRQPDGSLVKGIAGSMNSNQPAEPAGHIGRHFSADGEHFVFGTKTQLEPTGNGNGDVTLYERDLKAGTTQVVSTMTDGTTMTGTGIEELDVSDDGSRVIVGRLMGTDAQENSYYHLYMHVGTNPATIDLTPGTTSGVRYDGMTADGSAAYFTTVDPLTTPADQDTDTSADIFRAEVGSDGAFSLARLSIGAAGTGNTDVCSPTIDWNAPSGAGKCNALAFAGNAGLAAEDGTFYFLSPERLDVSDSENLPVQDEANLYVAEPGSAPRFVALMDSGAVKPPPPPPLHPLKNTHFAGPLSIPEHMAIDQSTGDLYVLALGAERLFRFDSTGAPKPFTAGPGNGTNAIPLYLPQSYADSQVAIDNSGGPLNGTIYVVASGTTIKAFALDGSERGEFYAGYTCGVTVDQSDGTVLVGAVFSGGRVLRYVPNSPTFPLEEDDFFKSAITVYPPVEACNLGADGLGHAYVLNRPNGPLFQFNLSDFTASAPHIEGLEITGEAGDVAVDPATHRVYVDQGNRISEYDSDRNLIATFGVGLISNSRGVAVRASDEHVFALDGSSIVEFDAVPDPSVAPINNPAVKHAVSQAATHTYGDFQVSRNGRYAIFSSIAPVPGVDNNYQYEVFRYDAQNHSLVCASCNPTNARAAGPSTLPARGLGIASDGKVFFDSAEALAPRDLDGRIDAYEYSNGQLQLISTGLSPFDSRVLGASEDGVDAYFFTRDELVPQDENGDLVKIYDARAGGGFAYVPPEVPCRASDECHGPGTESPPPPEIRTIRGSTGNESSGSAKKAPCKHGKVRRAGRCIKKHNKKNERRKGHRASRHGRGAGE